VKQGAKICWEIVIFIWDILLHPLFDMGHAIDQTTLSFSKSSDRTFEELKVNVTSGLTDQEAETRMTRYGLNKLQNKKKTTFLQMVVAQLKDALIFVLFGAVVITFFMGGYIDGIIILLVIIINAVLGVIQEIKAGNAIEALRNLTTAKALVKS